MRKNKITGRTPEEVADKSINYIESKLYKINGRMPKSRFGKPLVKLTLKNKELARKNLKDSLARKLKNIK